MDSSIDWTFRLEGNLSSTLFIWAVALSLAGTLKIYQETLVTRLKDSQGQIITLEEIIK